MISREISGEFWSLMLKSYIHSQAKSKFYVREIIDAPSKPDTLMYIHYIIIARQNVAPDRYVAAAHEKTVERGN